MATKLPELTEVPAGGVAVEFGRHTYICDPKIPLVSDGRTAVWGDARGRRIAVVGIYRPSPFDPPGHVRLGNWCGPRKGWEYETYPCPPNTAARVMAELVRAKAPRRGNAELQRFIARLMRAGV